MLDHLFYCLNIHLYTILQAEQFGLVKFNEKRTLKMNARLHIEEIRTELLKSSH